MRHARSRSFHQLVLPMALQIRGRISSYDLIPKHLGATLSQGASPRVHYFLKRPARRDERVTYKKVGVIVAFAIAAIVMVSVWAGTPFARRNRKEIYRDRAELASAPALA
jgi:hypothetical protein